MSRTVEFFGVQAQALGAVVKIVEAFQLPRPTWPEIDQRAASVGGTLVKSAGKFYDGGGDRKFSGLRAVALHGFTDWDEVLVAADSEQDYEPLYPGKVLVFNKPVDSKIRLLPPFRMPAIRLYNANGLKSVADGKPNPIVGQNWKIVSAAGDGSVFSDCNNVSGVAQQTYRWTGTAWVAGDLIGNGQNLSYPGVSILHFGPDSNGQYRYADLSPDGVYSFADYIIAKIITLVNGTLWTGPVPKSIYLLDSNGNPGDNSSVANTQYVSTLEDSITPLFYGRLALEMFWNECPPANYNPKLPPERVITFGQISVPANDIGGQIARTPVLEVPSCNVDEIQYTYRVAPGSVDCYADIRSPLADESASALAGIGTGAPAIVTAGNAGANLRGENVHTLAQLALGAPNGGAAGTILAGSQLVLRRRHIG